MIIKSITDCGRGKQKIALDAGDSDGGHFFLTGKEVRLLDLREGEELSEEIRTQIFALLRKKCLQRSGDLLSRRDYSYAGLEEKLLRDFPQNVVGPVLDELERAHYLDDNRFARMYVRSHMHTKSRMRLMQDLAQRGIDEETAREAVSLAFKEAARDGCDPETDQIRKILEKKGFDPRTTGWDERQKIMASIYRRGFSAKKIRSVMQEEQSAGE